jgi:SAM-dependent methyltransferase
MEPTEKPQSPTSPAIARGAFSFWDEFISNPSLYMLLRELRSALAGSKTVLDVGCGNKSPMRYLSGVHLTGIDGYAPALDEARLGKTHDAYQLGDVRRVADLFQGRHFDACVSLDVIEHLPKEDGWKMLEQMEKLATRRVIIFTPNGFIPQKSKDGDLQEHLSGWTADEMRQRGYTVLGIYGPKSLRGEYHRIKRQPRVFWLLISYLSHFLSTRRNPENAAAIFCVKNVSAS